MSNLKAFLTNLASSQNQSYARWKVLLHTSPNNIVTILSQIDYPILEKIHDERILRLIKSKFPSDKSLPNRQQLIQWCESQSVLLNGTQVILRDRIAKLASFLLILGQYLYFLNFGLTILSFFGWQGLMSIDLSRYFFMNLWGSFIAIRVLKRLRYRIHYLDAHHVFNHRKNWHLYILGSIVSCLILPELIVAFQDVILSDSSSSFYYFRIFAYVLSCYVLLFVSGKDFTRRKAKSKIMWQIGITFFYTYLGFIMVTKNNLPNSGLWIVLCFTSAIALHLYKKDLANIYTPIRDSLHFQCHLFKVRAIVLVWWTTLFTLLATLIQNQEIPYDMMIFTIGLAVLILLFAGMLPSQQVVRDVVDIYSSTDIAHSNDSIYQATKITKKKNIEEHSVKQWIKLYLLIDLLENYGFYHGFKNIDMLSNLPFFLEMLEK